MAGLSSSSKAVGSDKPVSLSVEQLSELSVWINGSFQLYDSVYIPLHLLEIQRELTYQIQSCKSQWMYPVVACLSLCVLFGTFLVRNHAYHRNKKALLKVQQSINKAEKEVESLMARFLKLKAKPE